MSGIEVYVFILGCSIVALCIPVALLIALISEAGKKLRGILWKE